MIRAAGILFVAPGNLALFVKRGPGGDYPGCWGFPGGRAEEGETAEQTARREADEEVGKFPDGALALWARQISPGGGNAAEPAATPLPGSAAPGEQVDFTTFLQRVPETFEPVLGPVGAPEHTGWAWAKISEPPEPLHPGCRVALARFSMDELGVARAIAAGELTSPQRYENMSLFDLRITGTGTAYRRKHDEYAYRRPENYLTDEFLARCNGLPVIWWHPPTDLLDSKEFAQRVVGTIMLPYIKGDEVWGVARIYDAEAIEKMSTDDLSTSPAVFWRDPDVNLKAELEDGSKVLIEGKPSLLDHLAICAAGVWDKGGEPSGISAAIKGELSMADDDKKADAEKWDKVMSGLDSIAKACDALHHRMDDAGKRMDALSKRMDDDDAAKKKKADDDDAKRRKDDARKAADDFKFSTRKDDDDDDSYKKRHDAEEAELKKKEEEAGEPEPVAADKSKKRRHDAEAAEKKADDDAKKKADAAAAAGNVTKADLDRITAMIPKAVTDADYKAMADAQAELDEVFSALGDSAPRPLAGETVPAYQLRALEKLKANSPTWKGVDLAKIAADSAAFEIAKKQVYADSIAASRDPGSLPDGQMRPITRKLPSGHVETTWAGRPGTWMRRLARPVQAVVHIGLQKGN